MKRLITTLVILSAFQLSAQENAIGLVFNPFPSLSYNHYFNNNSIQFDLNNWILGTGKYYAIEFKYSQAFTQKEMNVFPYAFTYWHKSNYLQSTGSLNRSEVGIGMGVHTNLFGSGIVLCQEMKLGLTHYDITIPPLNQTYFNFGIKYYW